MSTVPPGYQLVADIPDDRYGEWLDCWLGAFGNPVSADPEILEFYRRTHPPDRAVAVADDDRYVATNCALDRDLVLPGGNTVPAAACTGGSAHPVVARRGLLRSTVAHLNRRAVDEGKAIVVGGASEWPIYGRFGSGPATWSDAVEFDVRAVGLRDDAPGRDLRPRRIDGTQARDLAYKLYSQQAAQTPGEVLTPSCYWDRLAGDPASGALEEVLALGAPGYGPRHCAAIGDRGLVTYRIMPDWTAESAPQSKLHVVDFLATDQEAEGALWRHLFSVDLVREIDVWRMPVDSPLRWWVDDARRIRVRRQDALWIRPLDVPRLLRARGWACDGVITLTVHDPEGLAAGTFRLEVTDGHASCEPVTAAADLEMGVDALAIILLGGTPAAALARAGRISAPDARKVQLWDAMAAPERAPYISYWF